MSEAQAVPTCNNTSVGLIVWRGTCLLLLERQKFPPGMACPAGHVKRVRLTRRRRRANSAKKPAWWRVPCARWLRGLASIAVVALVGTGITGASMRHRWTKRSRCAGMVRNPGVSIGSPRSSWRPWRSAPEPTRGNCSQKTTGKRPLGWKSCGLTGCAPSGCFHKSLIRSAGAGVQSPGEAMCWRDWRVGEKECILSVHLVRSV